MSDRSERMINTPGTARQSGAMTQDPFTNMEENS